jgi:uncharacterized cupin superfamily protein
VGPNELRVKVGPDAGHTLVGFFESTMPPGGGFPFAHVHDEHEEVFSVLEGEVECRLGEIWTVATVGSTICVRPALSTPSATPAGIPPGTWSFTRRPPPRR